MKFSIITPTFKRSKELQKAVSSLYSQTYTNWEHIIINDSPTDESYLSFGASINDPRVRYFVNDKNRGVNFSRNFGLDQLSADSKWVIFLDDDDYLSPDALAHFKDLILLNSNMKWFVTNRAKKNGESMTLTPSGEGCYSYAWSYLILKRIKGDATHCIETKLITHMHARFSTHVKQAEEWIFFYQIGLGSKMYYSDHNSTISDGYDSQNGLNFRKRTFEERSTSLVKLAYEIYTKKCLSLPVVVYFSGRLLSLFIKRK